MSKPRILFVMHYFEIGGAETILIRFLQTRINILSQLPEFN